MPSLPPSFRPPWHQTPTASEQRRRYDRDRGSAAKRGYDRSWQKLRALVLAEEPLCRLCQRAGRVRPAEVVDHIVPIVEAPDRRLDRSNLQALCKACHDSTKQAADRRR